MSAAAKAQDTACAAYTLSPPLTSVPPVFYLAWMVHIDLDNSRCSLSGCKLVLLIHTLSIGVEIGHINCAHPHECGIHTVSLVALFNLRAAACHAFTVGGRQWRMGYGKLTHVVMIVPRHRAQLQPADHSRPATALGAHVVARWASLAVLVLQIAKVAGKHVGARARGHYIQVKQKAHNGVCCDKEGFEGIVMLKTLNEWMRMELKGLLLSPI